MKLLIVSVLVAASTASFAQQKFIPFPYKDDSASTTAQQQPLQQSQPAQQGQGQQPINTAIGVPDAPLPNAPSPNAPNPSAPSPNAPDWTIPANRVSARPDMPVNAPQATQQQSTASVKVASEPSAKDLPRLTEDVVKQHMFDKSSSSKSQ